MKLKMVSIPLLIIGALLTSAIVNAQITADFRVNKTEILTGEPVNFTDQSSGGGFGWLWLIDGVGPGGGSSYADSIQQNPVFTFNIAGVYNATLGVKDSTGTFVSWKTKTSLIIVQDPQDTFQVLRYCQDTLITSSINLRMLSVELETPSGSGFTDWDIFKRNPDGSSGSQLYEGHYNFNYQFNQGYFDWEHPPVRYFNPVQLIDTGLIQIKTPDTSGCMVIGYTLHQPCPVINFNYTITDIACYAAGTGMISFDSVTGGTPPYEYTITNGDFWQSSNTFDFQQAGLYALNVKDANNCEGTLVDDSVKGPATPLIPTQIFQTICTGDSFFTGGAWQSVPGVYMDTLESANGCDSLVITDLTISNCAPVAAFSANPQVVSVGGTVDFTDLSQGNPTSWFWDFGDGEFDSIQNPTHSYDTIGIYTVTLTVHNVFGFDSASGFVTVTDTTTGPCSLNITGQAFGITCFGATDGYVDVTDSGGVGIVSYVWNNGATSQDLVNVQGGIYSVTATDLNGCFVVDTFLVQTKSPIQVIRQITWETCAGANDGAINLTISGDYPPYAVYWSSGDTVKDILNLPSGLYSATISDASDCDTVISVNVGVRPPISVSAVATASTGSNGRVDLTITGGNSPYTINWSNGATTEYLENLAPGNYAVTVSNSGCSADSLTVTVDSAYQITGRVTGLGGFGDTVNITSGIVVIFGLEDPLGGYDTVDVVTISPMGIYRTGEILVDSVMILAIPNKSFYPDLIPTYFGGSQLWPDAQTHYASSPQPYDIICPRIPPPLNGNSTLNGVVLSNLGSNKRSDPIDNVGVSLKGQIAALVHFTRTDANGKFSIYGLQPGQYFITIDYPGIPMAPFNMLEFDFSGQTILVEMTINDDIIDYKIINTGIHQESMLSAVDVYPNPSDGRFTMQVASNQSLSLKTVITDLYGKVVYQEDLDIAKGINTAPLDLSELPSSIYLLSLTGSDNKIYWLQKVVVY